MACIVLPPLKTAFRTQGADTHDVLQEAVHYNIKLWFFVWGPSTSMCFHIIPWFLPFLIAPTSQDSWHESL